MITDEHMKSKWFWMMEWCASNGYSPANEYFWSLADRAYKQAHGIGAE